MTFSIRKRKKLRLISVGRLVDYKSYDFLLNALSQYKQNYSLDIVGDGLKETLVGLIKIRFMRRHGNISDEKNSNFLRVLICL